MSSLNKAMLIGRLGQDPEIKFLPTGNSVCNFSLATSETWKGQDGKPNEKTEWHRVVAFSKTAEICGQYLKKGKQVYIEGKIQTREWNDKDGNKRYATEIVCNQMTMLGDKSINEQKPSQPSDDDLPF